MTGPDWGFRALVMATLIGGTAMLIVIMDQISEHGIGHGLSVLLLCGFFPEALFKTAEWPGHHAVRGYEQFSIGIAAVMMALVIMIVLVEKSERRVPVLSKNGTRAEILFKPALAGIEPINIASGFVADMQIWAVFIPMPAIIQLVHAFEKGTTGYYALVFIFTALLYGCFSAILFNPHMVAEFLKVKGLSIDGQGSDDPYSRLAPLIRGFAVFGTAYLFAVFFAQEYFFSRWGFSWESLQVILVVAIGLDLIKEVRSRVGEEAMVRIADFHDVIQPGLARSLLDDRGIPCFLRGFHHRSLLLIMGPYVEVAAFVPWARREEASAILSKYTSASPLDPFAWCMRAPV